MTNQLDVMQNLGGLLYMMVFGGLALTAIIAIIVVETDMVVKTKITMFTNNISAVNSYTLRECNFVFNICYLVFSVFTMRLLQTLQMKQL